MERFQHFCSTQLKRLIINEVKTSLGLIRSEPWASANFFHGRAQVSRGGGKTYYLPNKSLKDTICSQKRVPNHAINGRQRPARGQFHQRSTHSSLYVSFARSFFVPTF